MARNLIRLLQASGVTAPTIGNSFDLDVPGTVTDVKVSDYLISAVEFTGQLPDPDFVGGYNSGASFVITATFARATQAYRIQRDSLAAWSAQATRLSGAAGVLGVSLAAFSSSGSPSGAAHTLTVGLTAPLRSGVTVNANTAAFGDPVDLYEFQPDPQPVRWTVSVSQGTPEQSTHDVRLTYSPDLGGFSPLLTNFAGLDNGWLVTVNHRAATESDYEFQWHTTAAYNDPSPYTGTQVVPFGNPPFTNPDAQGLGTLPLDTATLYLRYRPIGASTWINVGAVSYSDTRQPF